MVAVPHCLQSTQLPLLTLEGMSREARTHSEVLVQQLEDHSKTLAELSSLPLAQDLARSISAEAM
jgi:hypothetical protein